MGWHNIFVDNEGSISHCLRLSSITAGSILITDELVALKRENSDPILAVKITKWKKFIGYFGQSIEADQSRVGKKKIYFVHIGYIQIT